MNECRTCTHWKPAEDFDIYLRLEDDRGDAGRCYLAGLGSFTRRAVDNWGDQAEEGEDAGMFVLDGSDYKAMLITRGSFGCVKWSSK